jgi:outer membrane biosynthesis protein TonB
MKPRQIIRTGITVSAIAHLSALALVLLYAEVHPFGSTPAETITVDLVSPAEAPPAKKPEPAPEPKPASSDALDLSAKPEASATPPPAAPQASASEPQQPAAAQPQKQAELPTPRPLKQQAAVQPPSPAPSPVPTFTPPQPDLTIKYGVMLGLPPELPQGLPQDKPGDGFDAPASDKADVASSLVTEFRRHLRTCSKLPASIAPTDSVRIKLRVFMTPEGRIAAEPVVVEGTATLKGLDLRQSAIDALQACQPYTMLPADRYGEWKVLDLNFTPQDFTSAS